MMITLLICLVSALCTLEKIEAEVSAIRINIQTLSTGLRHVPFSKRDDLDELISDLLDDFEDNIIKNQLGDSFTQSECMRRMEVLSVYQYNVDKLADKMDQY